MKGGNVGEAAASYFFLACRTARTLFERSARRLFGLQLDALTCVTRRAALARRTLDQSYRAITATSRLYFVPCFSPDCSCCSSAFSQLELWLYPLIAFARTSVRSPRSFWYTTPSALTINVITPDAR
jgi:hypothetical protein